MKIRSYINIGLLGLGLQNCNIEKVDLQNPQCMTSTDFYQKGMNEGEELCLEGTLDAFYHGNEFNLVIRDKSGEVHLKTDPNTYKNIVERGGSLGKRIRVNGKYYYDKDSKADALYKNKLDISDKIEFLD